MKIINFEISKRLNDLGLLDNIETEYIISKEGGFLRNDNMGGLMNNWSKTLTLEELIKFISNHSNNEGRIYCIKMLQKELWDIFSVLEIFDIEMGEKMLEYLLYNILIDKK